MITPSRNTIKANTKFAQEVYKWFLNRKHGIGSCCGVELDRYYTKKENCDLGNRILDGYCMPEPVIPVPPDCPVECIEGSYATAYFNLLSLVFLPATTIPPYSHIVLTFNGIQIIEYDVDRSSIYSFSNQAHLSEFIQDCNQELINNSIPFTISFAESIPGAMGYGLVLTSIDQTNIYNDLIAHISIGYLCDESCWYEFELDSTISGGVISTC